MIRAADLFAGAGGCSTGLLQAATNRGQRVELVAVNHWPIAVETHTRNHPEAKHFCASVETLNPTTAVPGGKLDLLIAAPECVFFSTARGGKPIDDQRRASAWAILRWLEHLRVEEVLIENVPEMRNWAPLGANGRPLKSKKGHIFRAFIAAIEAMNYRVEWKVLNAADYGAATTRRRLFIRARRGNKAIQWPTPTHSKTGHATLFGGVRKWRAAREIIDWSLPSQSIFTRKRPLKPATIRRILEGLRRFGGPQLEPFLVILRNHMDGQSIDGPLPTVAAQGSHVGVAEPFIVPFLGERDGQSPRTKSIDEPVHTITAKNPIGLAEPVIVKLTHGDRKRERSIDEPLPTITSANRGELGIVEPFILGQQSNSAPRTTDAPIPTVAAAGKVALVEPFIVQPAHGSGGGRGDSGRVSSIDQPIGTQPACNRFALVEPFVLQQQSGGAPRQVGDPMPTIAADGAIGLVEPFIFANRSNNAPKSIDEPVPSLCTGEHIAVVEPLIAKYNSTAKTAKPVGEPLDTISTRDRFGLVQPVVNGHLLDIRFRMLQPHELSAAMSFPQAYVFTGNKGDQIRQIGNAVCCRMAEALCGAILDARPKPAKKGEAVA